MTDLEAFRADVVGHLEQSHSGRTIDQLAAGGLQMLYNRMVPPHMAVGKPRTTLEVRVPSKSRLTSKDLSAMTDRFARAVASIGREIADPKRPGQLSSADYSRAPIYTSHNAAGMVLFLATPEAPGLYGSDSGATTSERSLERLVSLMPESADDQHIAERVQSLRPTSARAVSEVAAVAKANAGLTLELRGGRDPISSVVTPDQADNIADLLSDSTEQVVTIPVKGRLDGMRFKRRMFYLQVNDELEFSGSVDEALMARVKHLLDHEVMATLEKVTRTSLAGRTSRSTYRLVGVSEQQENKL